MLKRRERLLAASLRICSQPRSTRRILQAAEPWQGSPQSLWRVSIKLLGTLSIRGARVHAHAHPYRQWNLSPESVYYQSNYVNSFWTVSICLSKKNQRKQCASTKPGRHNNIVLRSHHYLWLQKKKNPPISTKLCRKKTPTTLNGNKNILKYSVFK